MNKTKFRFFFESINSEESLDQDLWDVLSISLYPRCTNNKIQMLKVERVGGQGEKWRNL